MNKIEKKWIAFYLSGIVPIFFIIFAGSGSHAGGEIEYVIIAFGIAIGAIFIISLPLLAGLLFFRNSTYIKCALIIPPLICVLFILFYWLRL